MLDHTDGLRGSEMEWNGVDGEEGGFESMSDVEFKLEG